MTPVVRYFSLVGLFCACILTGTLFAMMQMQGIAITQMGMAVTTLGLLMSEGK